MDIAAASINDIAKQLDDANVYSELVNCRTLMAKVLNLLGRGVDVSGLAPQMAKLLAHPDPVVKKGACEFVSIQTQKSSSLVLLVVNSLLRDCSDSSPMNRGLALRTLCSLKQDSAAEHMMQAVIKGISDRSTYVRRIAVISCIRVYWLVPQLVIESEVVDKLYSLIKDPDPIVTVNCLSALNEILHEEGGIVLNQRIAHHLLNVLPNLTCWGKEYVLNLLKKYKPKEEEEIFNILNLIDRYLKDNNCIVFTSCLKLFLHFTSDLPHLRAEVIQRCKDAFLSALSSGNVELTYSIINFIENILNESKEEFCKYFKSFFCRFKEPPYLKIKKIDLLPHLVTEANICEILEELSMYCSEVSSQVSFCAMEAIGKIAKSHPDYFDKCIQKLQELLEIQEDNVQANVLKVIQGVDLRCYTALTELMTTICSGHLLPGNEDGCCAKLWLIGEYGHRLDSPCIIEEFIDSFLDECDMRILTYLLTTTMKLFLHRPAECQDILGKLLEYCINSENMELQDKAHLYYMLLKMDISLAEKIVLIGRH